MIIFFLGHSISNCKTKLFNSLLKLQSKFKWILTGTPIQNSLKDLGGYFAFLKIEPWTDFQKFRYLIEKENPLQTLSEILPKIFLRRTKESVDPKTSKKIVDLPEKKILFLEVEFKTEIESEIYEAIAQMCKQGVALDTNPMLMLTMRLKLLQACSDPLMLVPKDKRNYQNYTADLQNVRDQLWSKVKKTKANISVDELADALDSLTLGSRNENSQCALCLEIAESKIEMKCCQKVFCHECLILDAKSRGSHLCLCEKTDLGQIPIHQVKPQPNPNGTIGWMSSKVSTLIFQIMNLPKRQMPRLFSMDQ